MAALREQRLRGLWNLLSGNRATTLLLQQPARRLSALRWSRNPGELRSRPHRSRRHAFTRRRRNRAVGHQENPALLRPAPGFPCRASRHRHRYTLAQPAPQGARRHPVRHRHDPGPIQLGAQRGHRAGQANLGRCDRRAGETLEGERRSHPRRASPLHQSGRLSRVQGYAAAPRGSQHPRGGVGHPRAGRLLDRPGHRVPRGIEARSDAADHRGADPEGDSRAAELPLRRGARLPDPRSRQRHPLWRRGAAHPPRHPGWLQSDGRALHPRRALHRSPLPRQPPASREPEATSRPGQQRDRRGARRSHHPQRQLRPGHGSRRRHPRRPGRRRGHAGGDRGESRLPHRRLPGATPLDPGSQAPAPGNEPGPHTDRTAANTT